MYINYITNQTMLTLELGSYILANYLVFTVEKVVNDLNYTVFESYYREEGRPCLTLLKCFYHFL